MKKSTSILATVLLSSAVLIAPAFAAVDVEDAMKDMSKSYRLVMKDTDAASLKKGAGKPAATALLEYLKRETARNIMQKYGYIR